MYSVSPYYDCRFAVDKPTCMYDLKCVYSKNEFEASCNSSTHKSLTDSVMTGVEKTEVANLEKRQISLINQLKDLTLLLKNIKGKLLAGPPNKIGPVVHPLKTGELLDVVIQIPHTCNLLAVLTLSSWLQQRYLATLKFYLHSSLTAVQKRWSHFFENHKQVSQGSSQLTITIIVKEGIDVPRLRVSSKQRVLIAGEANILRYFGTLLWPQNSFEDPVRLTEVDQWLDLADLTCVKQKSTKEILDTLNSHLAGKKYLVGDTLSIADIGFLSWMIFQRNTNSKLPQNVMRWKHNCCSDPAVKLAWEMSDVTK